MINRQDAMTDGRTISVVMCTYNGAKFVAEQIESIIGQTYPIYELIIQDVILRMELGKCCKAISANIPLSRSI